jgi:hypothetical protein
VHEVLERELDLLVRRLRGFTPARYGAAAPPFPTRADAAWHLAQRLVELAGTPERIPELPVAALPDVLTVVGRDLLETDPDPATTARALAEVLLHRYDVDGAPPGPHASAQALRVLDPDAAPVPQALLVAARRRCPAYA